MYLNDKCLWDVSLFIYLFRRLETQTHNQNYYLSIIKVALVIRSVIKNAHIAMYHLATSILQSKLLLEQLSLVNLLKYEICNSSVSCQLAVIGSHGQLSNEQKRCISKQTRSWLVHIQTNTFVCTKSFTRKALAIREKLCPSPSLLINIKSCYKRNGLIGWLFRWLL